MKRLFVLLALICLVMVSPVQAADQIAEGDTSEEMTRTVVSLDSESYDGDPLCMPDIYLKDPQDCLPLGPSATLTEFARLGVQYPPSPLAAGYTPSELNQIPYSYIKITHKGELPVYNSVEDALAKNIRRTLPNGFIYFSYNIRDESKNGIYYRGQAGEWIWGGYVSRITPPSFQGFIFQKTPATAFGWILDQIESCKEPGYGCETSGFKYTRFNVVNVYNVERVEDTEWYLIGINEWVQKKDIAVVQPYPIPPEGVDNGRWIEIDLYQQTVTVYDQGELVFATLTSSGSPPFYTQPGLFQIYEKLATETMSTGDKNDYYYLEDVPWTMYFDQSRALHGAYWHSRFGSTRSHGCVNLSIADSRWLFDWAEIGEWVYVWDPSGQTPTDPSLYTGGGP